MTGSREKDSELKSGSVSVYGRAGLSAGVGIDATFTGPSFAAASGEIDVYNEFTAPVTPTIPLGTRYPGKFMLAIEGSNSVIIGNGGLAESIVEFDLLIKGRDKKTSWTDGINNTPTSSLLVPIGPSPDPRRILYAVPATYVAGEKIAMMLTVTADAQAFGTGTTSGYGPGMATVAQHFANTVSYDFIPDNPTAHLGWGSDPYFGGAQPKIVFAPVPWPSALVLTLSGLGVLCGVIGRRKEQSPESVTMGRGTVVELSM